uniref:Actin related protein 6 n=2 Tax=Eptatretus burgeri TaxID=7764 RepID=A0A8C4PWY1_EPTBU
SSIALRSITMIVFCVLLFVDFAETNIIMTEPYFNFRSIQESMNEILFEEYQFHAICRINGGTLSAHKYLHEHPSELCCLVVDSGFSFTHIVPFYKGRAIKSGIRRLNVGGKLLSNHLKEIISYRQLHVMDETYVINQVKEDVCYVSQQFYKDMKVAQLKGEENTILTDYVLPDFSTIRKGYCKERKDMIWSGKYPSGEQVLRLSNERFAVPEIMFHPSDIGIQEMGIPEAIRCAVESLTPEMQPHMYQNIVLTGGSSLFPGYRDRVFADVRSLSPDEFRVSVTLPENPITHAWTAGSMLSRSPSFSSKHLVTRRQYEEQGQDACESKFDV